MTREEYYAGIEAYKNKLEHRAMDANAEDTAGKALENWKNQYLNQAVNLRAKQYLASKSGRTDDASTYEKQLQILLDKMTNLKGVSLSAKQAILQTIDQTATNKANVQYAKHSDEPEDGVLEHGGEWKKHKYIRIENGRYIYPEDLESKKLREDAANQRNVSKGMQEIAAFDKYLLNNGKNSDGSPVKKDKELSKELQKDYDQSMAWSAATQAQEKGMLRKAEDLKAQADKKRFDAAAANTAKVNEERKEKAVNNNNQSVQTARSQSDESAAKAQREGEAMQAWKNAKAVRAKDDNSKNQAQAEGDAYQKWKNAQAVRSKDEGSKNAAQSEGEAYQKWKIKQDAKKGEGESYEKAQREGEAMDKYNRTKNIPYTEAWWNEEEKRLKAISAKQDRNFVTITTETANGSKNETATKTVKSPRERIKSGEATADDIRKEIKNKSNEVKNQVYEEAKKYGKDAVVEATELEPDTGAPQRFVIKANNKTVYDTGNFLLEYDEWNYTRAKHSLNLTREEYYAGIEEYKRKKA